MRWRRALRFAATAAAVLTCPMDAADASAPIWADASRTDALWVSGEALNAVLNPETLRPRSDAQPLMDAAESAELKLQLERFRDYRPGGWVSQADADALVCPNTPHDGMGAPLTDEPKKTLAKLILAKNEGFVAVGQVESVEAGWSPKYGMVLSLLTLRDVRALWSSSAGERVSDSIRILQTGGWLTLAGIRICRDPFPELGKFRIGDRYLVWGYEDPVNDGLVLTHFTRIVHDERIDTQCASCIRESALSLDQLENDLQGEAR